MARLREADLAALAATTDATGDLATVLAEVGRCRLPDETQVESARY